MSETLHAAIASVATTVFVLALYELVRRRGGLDR